MGMSTHVIGFKPPDDRWKAMKAARDACVAADVEIPEEISDFFEDQEPDEAGVEVQLDEAEGVKEYRADGADGFELEVAKLPKDVKIVRFYNSY